jgi:hypothetical protein
MKRIITPVVLAVLLALIGCTNEFVKIGNPPPNPLPEIPGGSGTDAPPNGGGNDPVTTADAGKAFWKENPKWSDGSTYALEIDAEKGTALFASVVFEGTRMASIVINGDGSFGPTSPVEGLSLAGSSAEGNVKVIGTDQKVVATIAKADFANITDYMAGIAGKQAEKIGDSEAAQDEKKKGDMKKIFDMGNKP